MNIHNLLLFAHVASVVVWIGGMFFAYVCLRPTAAAVLEPPLRLKLWVGVFGRFFRWVWLAVTLIPASGLTMMASIGFATAPKSWHLMLTLGLVMIAIYVFVATIAFPALRRAVEAGDWPAGGAALGRIRQAVSVNLGLGVLTVAVATLGRGF